MKNNYLSKVAELIKSAKTKLVLAMIISFASFGTGYAQNCAVNAGVTQNVCENEVLTLYGGFTGVSGGAYYWTQVSGPSVLIDDPGSLTTNVTGISGPSTLGFRLYGLCGDGSIVWDEVTHIILPITDANAGADQSSCPGANIITMNANPPVAGETGAWTILGGAAGVTINSPSSPTTTLSLSQTTYGTALLTWSLTSATCQSIDTVYITNCGGEATVSANRSGSTTINLGSCYTTTQSYTANASYPGNPACGQLGVWNVINGPGIPAINNVNARNATFSGLIEGTYVLQWTVSGSCTSGSDILTINVPAPVGEVTSSSPSGGIFCEGITEAILSGDPPLYTGETVTWTRIGGPVCNIVSPNSPTTAVTGLDGVSTYTFRYTIANVATGCSSSANTTISYTAPPSLTLGPDQSLGCGVDDAFVPYTSTGSGALYWQIIAGPAGNPDYPSYPTAWYTASASPVHIENLNPGGTYVIVFRKVESAGSGCSSVYETITITNSTYPSGANAGSGQFLACNVDTTFLVANDPAVTGGGFGTWYQVSKPDPGNDAIIEDPTNHNTKVSNLSNGKYVFRWLITGGGFGCETTQDDVDVIVASATPTLANAGPSETICYGTPYQLQGNPVISNESGTWTVSPSAGVIIYNPNAHNTWIDGLSASTAYTFTWTITNACGLTSDNTTITTSGIQGPVAADAGADDCFALGTTIIPLGANSPLPGTGMWYTISTPGAVTFDDPTDESTNMNITMDGTYVIEWVISDNGCSDARDTVEFTVSDLPGPSDAGPAQYICGDSTDMMAVTPLLGTGEWVQVIGPPGIVISDVNDPNATVTGFLNGKYGLEWTVSNDVCFGGRDTAYVYASLPPDTAHAGPDQFICGSLPTTMAANPITNNFAYWVMIDGPNTPTFDLYDPLTTVSGMIMGTYTFTWNSVNAPNCTASVDTVLIELVATASVVSNREFCDTISVTLSGNPNSVGYWEQVMLGGEPVINIIPVGNSTAIADSLLPGSGFTDYAFRYVIDYPGCVSADTTFISVYEKPSVAAGGIDQVHCNASSFTMAASMPISGNGAWSILTGPAGGSFVDPFDPNTSFNGAVPGTYIFLWSVENGVCSNADPVRIENYQPPSVADASFGVYQDYYCDSVVVMQGNLPVYGVGTWTQKSGPVAADIVSPILPNTEIRNLEPGRYWFYWTIANGPVCPVSIDSIELVIAVRPTIPEAGPDQEICEVAPVQTNMAGNAISIGLGTWSQHSGPAAATIAAPNSNTTLISDMIAGLYEFVWTADTDSCSFTDTVEVLVYELPTIAEAGNDSTICLNANLALYADPATIGTGTWSQMSGPSASSFVDPNSPTTGVYGLTSGVYKFEWRTANGPCLESVDSVEITISPLPTLSDAGLDQEYCEQDSTRLDGNIAALGTGMWTQTGGPPCTIKDPALPNTDVIDLQYGTVTFTWTITNGACESVDDVRISRYELPTMADAGFDQTHCNNVNYAFLDGNTPLVGGGLWTQTAGPNVANIVFPVTPNTEVNGLIPGLYKFVWTISTPDLCPSSNDTVYIDISNCPPIALNNFNNTFINTPVAGEVLFNDRDPEGDPITINTTPITPPTNGTVTINPDGTYLYTPAPGFTGNDSFVYEICDNGAPPLCDQATVFITVIDPDPAANNPPVANDDAYLGLIDTPVSGSVIGNDFDPDFNLDPNSVNLIGVPPTNGILVLNPDGTFDFTPNPGFTGQVTFNYQICDLGIPVYCDIATVTIDILPNPYGVNQTFAVDDAYYGEEDTPINGSVLDNDYDPEGNTQTVNTTPLVGPAYGSLTLNGDGTFTYIPDPDFTGVDQFIYEVCDNGIPSACDTATVYLLIGPSNDPPVAENDINNTFVDTPVDGNLLTNDTDPNGDPITINTTPITPPSNGSVVINPDGTYTYTPNPGYTGTDTFVYEICDDGTPPLCDQATATITIIDTNPNPAVNNPPVANNDAYQGTIDLPVVGTVISNDWDPDFNLDPNSITLNGPPPANGVLVLNPNGTFTFVPNPGFTGQVTFDYQVCDLGIPIYCDIATVTIDILPNPLGVNTTFATDDSYFGQEGTPIPGAVLLNDNDPEGNTQTVNTTPISGPSNGTLVLNGDGTFIYTPNPGYNGPDNFVYEVCDDGVPQACDYATVYLSVDAVNDPPVAIDDINNTFVDTPVDGDLLTNDYDPDGDPITINTTPITPPSNGSVVINPDGTYTYTPAPGFTGEDTFVYEICDNAAPPLCDQATATITIIDPDLLVNNPPVANNDAYQGSIDLPVIGTVLGNDWDPDFNLDPNSVTLIGPPPANGTLTLNADGTFTFVPNPGWTGQTSFDYQICDTGIPIYCDIATVTIDILPNPLGNSTFAVDDAYYFDQDTPLNGQVLTNDYDPEGNTQTVTTTPLQPPANGSVVLQADGSFLYIPNPGYIGPDQFVYEVCDDGIPQACDQATVYLMAGPVNAAPIIISANGFPVVNDTITGFMACEITDFDICMLANDPNGDNLSVSEILVLTASGATTSDPVPEDLCFTYIPAVGFSGTDTLRVIVCDDHAYSLCDTVYMIIEVVPQVLASAGPDDEICESDGSYTLSAATATDYTDIIWTTDGTGTFSDSSLVNPVYTPTLSDIQDGQIILTINAYGDGTCPDVSDYMILTIWPVAEVYAGKDDTICAGSTFQPLDATAQYYTALLWTTSGDGTFNNDTLLYPVYTPGPNDITAGTVDLTITATANGTCPVVVDDLTLTITTPPSAYAGIDAEICETGMYLLADASAADYSSIMWTSTGTGSFSDATIVNPLYTPSQNDIDDGFVILTITAYANGSCVDAFDNMTLTISKLPEVYAGADAEICVTDISYTISDATAANQDSLLWTTVGDGSFDDDMILHPVYTPGPNDIIAGTAELVLLAYGSGSCMDASDTLDLTITAAPTAFAGADAEICETDVSYAIADATATDYASLEWTSDGDGLFDNINALNPTYIPGLNDVSNGNVILTLTAFGNGSCGDEVDDMTLTISTAPSANAGMDAEICETAIFYLLADATAADYDSLLWTTSGDGSFNDAMIVNPEYTPGTNDITGGTVVLTITAYGAGSCVDAVDDMTLSITLQATAFAGLDAEICETGLYSLADATATNYNSVMWTSSGSGSFTDPAIVNPVYTPSQNDIDDGFVILTLTSYANGSCVDAMDAMTLTITPQASVYAGLDAEICETDILYLLADATAEDYDSLAWTTAGDGTFNDATILNPEYTPGTGDIAGGSVVLTITAYGSGSCVDVMDDMTLSITLQPTAFAGADAEICETAVSYTIADATATEYASLEWTTDGDGLFDDIYALNPTYTPGLNDINNGSVILTLTAYANGSCADVMDDMTLSVSAAASAYAGLDAEICETAIMYLLADAIAVDYDSIQWTSSGDGTFNNALIVNPEYTPGTNDVAGGSAVLTITAYGAGSCADAIDNMTLSITPQATAFAGVDAEICETGSYSLADATASNYSSVTWTSSGTGNFSDPGIVNPVYTPSQNDIDDGLVVLTLTAYANGSCADVVDAMTLSISPSASAYAGPDAEICETLGSYNLIHATAADYDSLLWTTSGDGSFIDPAIVNAQYTPGPNDIFGGTVVLTITAYGSGPCAGASDDMTLTISMQPTAFAGLDAQICETGVYLLADATASDYTSLMWTSTGNGSFNDPTALNPLYTPSQNDIDDGFVILSLTAYANGSCVDAVDAMILSISPQASAYAGADAAICETDLSYTILDSDAEYYTSLLWTTTGDGSWDNATVLHPEYTPGLGDIANGSAELILTAFANGSCIDAVDTMTLFISLLPTAYAGPDDEMCESDVTYTLAYATASQYTSILWTTDGTGTFNDPTALNPIYAPSLSDIQDGQVRLTITANGDGVCPDASDEMLLTIWPLSDAFAGLDAIICEGENYQLWDATAIDYTSILWTTSGDGFFDNPTGVNPIYNPGTGDIAGGSVVLTITAGSAGTCPDVSDDMTLSITLAPSSFAGVDAEICETDAYTLADATVTNYASLMWTTSGDGTFDDPTLLNPVYTPGSGDIVYGSAFLTLTAYANGSCSDSTDTMTLTITSAPIVYAGVDAHICETETYVLIDASAENYGSLAWATSGDGSFDDPTILHPEYFPGIADIINGSVELTLTATGLGSCPDASDMMILEISPQPFAYAGPDAEICESEGYYTLSGASANGFVTIKWTTDGTGTFNSTVSVNPTYTPSQMDIDNGQVTLTITAYGDGYCPDAIDFMVLTIWESAEVYAGGDAEICEGETYQILDATAENYASLLWTTSGDGAFDDASILTPVYTPGSGDIAAGSAILTLTAEGLEMCPDAIDDMELIITAAVVVSAGPDDETCELNSYTISGATASNYSSLLWITSGDGTFDDETALNPVYTPGIGDISFGSAMLTITAYGNGSCGDASDLMTLTISGAAVAFAGYDNETCEYNSYILEDATAENYSAIMWTTSGDGIFVNPTELRAVYNPGPGDIANGLAILRITLSGIGSCDDTWDEMILMVTSAPVVYAGDDADICETDGYHLADATASVNTFVEWTTSGDGAFDDPNAVNPIYIPGAIDLSTGGAILTITGFGSGSCEDVSDQMTLTIHSLPEAEAGDGGVICYGEPFQITDASADNYAYLLWTSSGDGFFSDDAILEPVYYSGPMDVAAGFAELTLTAYGYGSCGTASDMVVLSVNASPIADAGIDQFIPPGTPTQLNGNAVGGSGSYTYSWIPGDFIINSNAQNPTTFDLFITTEFVLTVTDNLTGCSDMDTVIVFMENPHDPPVAVDDYDTTFVNVPIVIDILANDYDPEGGILTANLCGGPSNGIAIINSDGTATYTPYNGYVGDDSFCYYICDDGTPSLCDSAMVYIHVKPLSNIDDNIIIYNGITPNDDGVNDFWFIDGIENYPDNEVLVFNRWGDILREINGYDNVNEFWNGTNKHNEILPDGTYYYVIKILYEGQTKYYKGWVYIHGVKK